MKRIFLVLLLLSVISSCKSDVEKPKETDNSPAPIFLFDEAPKRQPVEIRDFDIKGENIRLERFADKDRITLNRWGGECYIKVARTEKDIIVGMDGDNFKIDIVLTEKPASNIFEFDIETKDLVFYYQPELTQKEIDEGCIRPDNVVGSYAVYHKYRGNIHKGKADAEKYKCGKAFHIYRPKIVDSGLKEVWAALHIDNGKMAITIPQEFLDTAKYPITIDPDFGVTDVGGSWIANSGDIMWSNNPNYNASGGDGTATYIKVYAAKYSTYEPATKCALYKSSDQSLKGATEEETITSFGGQWYQYDITSGGTIENTNYYIPVWGDNYYFVAYDDLSVRRKYDVETYNGFPATASFVDSGYNITYSIYCHYEEGGEPTPTPTATPTATPTPTPITEKSQILIFQED